jgi:transcriptional regulator with XRE-family HTH domain
MKPPAVATPDQVRETLRALAAKAGVPLAPLSRTIGRRSGYLSEFIRGIGRERLTVSEQEALARFFRVDRQLFGYRGDSQRNFEEVRKRLQERGFEGRAPLVALSRMLGKRPGYLSTFVRGDGADYLTTADRQKLAQFFRVDPSEFGDDGST